MDMIEGISKELLWKLCVYGPVRQCHRRLRLKRRRARFVFISVHCLPLINRCEDDNFLVYFWLKEAAFVSLSRI